MNRRKPYTPMILAGLALLAAPVFAQSSGSTPGTSGSNTSSDPNRPGASSSSSGSVTGSSSTDSSSTGSGITTPRSSSTTGSSQAGVVGQLNSNFSTIDKDSDGKISESEFTQQASASGSTSSGATPRSGGMSGVSGGAQYSAEQFRQYDKNHDGYLTRDELNASSNSSSSSSSTDTRQ